MRILSATHTNLNDRVQDGRFRHDLFYRINVIELHVPPLRKRTEDIPLLADAILRKLAVENGDPGYQLAADASKALRCYAFPGNVRELENILERAVALCDAGVIHESDLRLPSSPGPGSTSNKTEASIGEVQVTQSAAAVGVPTGDALPDFIESLEREAIQKALIECKYNKTKAAAKLGITFRAMRYKLKKLGIE